MCGGAPLLHPHGTAVNRQETRMADPIRVFSRNLKLGVDKRESSGYNNQAVFSGGKLICGCAGTGRQASLRCWCRIDVWVQVPSAAPFPLRRLHICARVVELADSLDSGSSVLYGRAGSSPASRTIPKNDFRRRRRKSFFGNPGISLKSPEMNSVDFKIFAFGKNAWTPHLRRPLNCILIRASGGIGRLARFRF